MNQKEEEHLIIEYFRDACIDFPKGKLIKSESPDFVLKINRKEIIGIELTRLSSIKNKSEKQVYDNPEFNKENLEKTILKKRKKFYLYQKRKFKTIWLIIYSDFLKTSSAFNIQNKITKWSFFSEFHKVFLFDLFEKKIYVIK
ncbi:MAG: hypothetical protein K8R68_06090 [Bacteroidales bacterium]|nr:hypothetical protein [Bacteroidales bacterium]